MFQGHLAKAEIWKFLQTWEVATMKLQKGYAGESPYSYDTDYHIPMYSDYFNVSNWNTINYMIALFSELWHTSKFVAQPKHAVKRLTVIRWCLITASTQKLG